MGYAIEYTSTINNRTGIVTSGGTLLPANDKRRTLVIQNLGGAPLFVKFGAGASTTSFDFVLSAGTVNDDGRGGIFAEDTLSYTGIISVASATTVRCTATEW